MCSLKSTDFVSLQVRGVCKKMSERKISSPRLPDSFGPTGLPTLTMKKYRYTKTVIVTPWRKFATVLYFLAGWNIIGYGTYKIISKKFEEKHPGFDNMSSKDKYLTMIGYKKENLETVKINPFGIGEKDSAKEMKVVAEESE